MSLALVALRDDRAIVVTDGAVTRTYADGRRERARNDFQKLYVVAPGLVLVVTNLAKEVFEAVKHFAAGRPVTTFNDLGLFLTKNLPAWHREDAERRQRRGVAQGTVAGAGVALVGYDTQADRVRLVAFGEGGDDYRPCEGMQWLALGVPVPERLQAVMTSAIEDEAPWSTMEGIMSGIVEDISREDDRVGGTIYTANIYPADEAAAEPVVCQD